MHRGLVALAAILMFTAPAMAAEQYEHIVWEDGIHVAPGGGLDLIELRMWEADLRDGGPGIMLRLLMESRAPALGGPDEMHVNGTILGPSKQVHVHLWTDDHASWYSDQRIVHNVSKAKAVNAGLGSVALPDIYTHDVWIFIPLGDLGVVVGQRIDGFTFDAYGVSDSQWSQMDTAPGGYWPLGSETEFPEPGATPEENALSVTAKKIPSYFLGGAGHHLNATGAWEDGIVMLEIHNPYDKTDQHIDILAPEAAKALGTIPTELKANSTVYALYQVPQTSQAQELAWDIRSHFGGVARLELKLEGLPAVPEPEPKIVYIELERQDPVVHEEKHRDPPAAQPEPEIQEPGKDSPIGAVALVAVAALAILRRRRE